MGVLRTRGMHGDLIRRLQVFQNGMASAAFMRGVDITVNRIYTNSDSFTINISVNKLKFAVTLPHRGFVVAIHHKKDLHILHRDVHYCELYSLSFLGHFTK